MNRLENFIFTTQNPKTMFKPYFILVVASLFVLLHSCKKDDSPNPCCGEAYKPAKADFDMGVPKYPTDCFGKNSGTQLLGDDTLFPGPTTFLVQTPYYDSLEWRIGEDKRVFTSPEFTLQFTKPDIGTSIEVTLKVYKKASECYPGDDGVDSLTKTFHIVHILKANKMAGKFKGALVGETQDSFTMEIIDYDTAFNIVPTRSSIGIYNFNNEFTRYYDINLDPYTDNEYTYRYLTFCLPYYRVQLERDGRRNQKGTIYYSADYNQLEINYTESIDPTEPNEGENSRSRTFKGHRVN